MTERCGGSGVLREVEALHGTPSGGNVTDTYEIDCPGCSDCRPCTRCKGEGTIEQCGLGRGEKWRDPCYRCHGTGVEPEAAASICPECGFPPDPTRNYCEGCTGPHTPGQFRPPQSPAVEASHASQLQQERDKAREMAADYAERIAPELMKRGDDALARIASLEAEVERFKTAIREHRARLHNEDGFPRTEGASMTRHANANLYAALNRSISEEGEGGRP